MLPPSMKSSALRLMRDLVMIAVLLLAFWLRIQELDVFPPGLSNDEAVNTVDAFHIGRTGNFPLYEDPNRPEPLYRLLLAGGTLLWGTEVWSFRFTSALIGLLSIAAAYWAAGECLRDTAPGTRRAAGIAAAAALTVALGHITLSRNIYRAIPQPLFMFMYAGFLMRGLRARRRSDFALAGLSLVLAMYTYTAALVMPLSMGFVVAALLLFRPGAWRSWLLNLILSGAVVVLLFAPVAIIFLNNPTAVIGRASEVQQAAPDIGLTIRKFADQFFVSGDVNPQYNVESAPLLPDGFVWLFVVGLGALLIRIRQPSSWLIAAFLLLGAIPVILANEIPHGLRSIGEFAAFPLMIGLGVALILSLVRWIRPTPLAPWVVVAIIGALTLRDGLHARQTYNAYWSKAYLWAIHGLNIPHAEWFYRTDRRELAQWLVKQNTPLLVPLDELGWQTVRTWLMPDFPDIQTATDDFTLPAGTRLVVPWSLEQGDLMRETRNYALLSEGSITLLPPLSAAAHAALLQGIDQAEAIEREGVINHIARTKLLPKETTLSFEPRVNRESPVATFGDSELQLLGWRGPDALSGAPEDLTYTLEWLGLKRMGHEYSAFLQIQTQDYQRIAGDDVRINRWLYPTTVWQPGAVVPDVHRLQLAEALEPGAYRLVAGVYPFAWPDAHLPVILPDGHTISNPLTIGWLKVPQKAPVAISFEGREVNAVFDGAIRLRAILITPGEEGVVRFHLTWEALVERPSFDATIFVQVVDSGRQIIAQQDVRPWGGQYPTFIWSAGELVQTEHFLDMGNVAPDDLDVLIGMYTFPGPNRLPATLGGAELPDRAVLLEDLSTLLEN